MISSANYYPITQGIAIEDKSKNLLMSVMNDRPQGGSAYKDGRIELMIQRRVLKDDGLGLPDVLNDVSPVNTIFQVSFS